MKLRITIPKHANLKIFGDDNDKDADESNDVPTTTTSTTAPTTSSSNTSNDGASDSTVHSNGSETDRTTYIMVRCPDGTEQCLKFKPSLKATQGSHFVFEWTKVRGIDEQSIAKLSNEQMKALISSSSQHNQAQNKGTKKKEFGCSTTDKVSGHNSYSNSNNDISNNTQQTKQQKRQQHSTNNKKQKGKKNKHSNSNTGNTGSSASTNDSRIISSASSSALDIIRTSFENIISIALGGVEADIDDRDYDHHRGRGGSLARSDDTNPNTATNRRSKRSPSLHSPLTVCREESSEEQSQLHGSHHKRRQQESSLRQRIRQDVMVHSSSSRSSSPDKDNEEAAAAAAAEELREAIERIEQRVEEWMAIVDHWLDKLDVWCHVLWFFFCASVGVGFILGVLYSTRDYDDYMDEYHHLPYDNDGIIHTTRSMSNSNNHMNNHEEYIVVNGQVLRKVFDSHEF